MATSASLVNTFTDISLSIVAIIDRFVYSPDQSTPVFPQVIGTGFFVDSGGIVATNRHIVQALKAMRKHPTTGRRSGAVFAFGRTKAVEGGSILPTVIIPIANYTMLDSFTASKRAEWFGTAVPDVGFLQVEARETPALALAVDPSAIRPGVEIATAGFPMGERLIVGEDKVQQVSCTLRHGVIASVFPYEVEHPHGFTIDIMTQGGESGSPVFKTDEAVALGMIAAGIDFVNYTSAEPAWIISQALQSYKSMNPVDFSALPTYESYFATPKLEALVWELLPFQSRLVTIDRNIRARLGRVHDELQQLERSRWADLADHFAGTSEELPSSVRLFELRRQEAELLQSLGRVRKLFTQDTDESALQ